MKSKSNPDILKMAAEAAKRSERTMRSKVGFHTRVQYQELVKLTLTPSGQNTAASACEQSGTECVCAVFCCPGKSLIGSGKTKSFAHSLL